MFRLSYTVVVKTVNGWNGSNSIIHYTNNKYAGTKIINKYIIQDINAKILQLYYILLTPAMHKLHRATYCA